MGIDGLVPLFAVISPFFLTAWIFYVIHAGKRRSERLKATSEFYNRLFDRLGSMKEFGEFMETDGGKKFMNSISAESPKAAGTHIVRSVENGIVCLAVGAGVLMSRWAFPEVDAGFTIIGTIVAACGVGLLISSGASYSLSKTLGLLDGRESEPRALLR